MTMLILLTIFFTLFEVHNSFAPRVTSEIRPCSNNSCCNRRLKTLLYSINNKDEEIKKVDEEILMKVSFSVQEDFTPEKAIPIIQKYISSFPFSAVLPVQPLTYTPNEDDLGVKVAFLRKKTDIKSGKDGGIDFRISTVDDENDEAIRVNIVARRDSNGQFISKVFSEGAIIKSFVSGLNHGEAEGGRVGIGREDLMKACSVQSIYHKWM